MITYLHTDHLLTPRIGTSDVQNIGWQWEGEVFGDIDAQGPTEINLRFPGQYLDSESEQHYNISEIMQPRWDGICRVIRLD